MEGVVHALFSMPVSGLRLGALVRVMHALDHWLEFII